MSRSPLGGKCPFDPLPSEHSAMGRPSGGILSEFTSYEALGIALSVPEKLRGRRWGFCVDFVCRRNVAENHQRRQNCWVAIESF